MRVPEPMRAWVAGRFGSVESVEEQWTIRITNRWTYESAIFNALRSQRPVRRQSVDAPSGMERTGYDPFAHLEEMTPEDTFGRLRGRHVTTAGNVARYEGFHSLLIFDEPDPLQVSADALQDALDVARRWFETCHDIDNAAIYPLIIWNGGARGGASIPHAHAQITLARDHHYAAALRLRDAAGRYRRAYGCGYFDDLFGVHEQLGLGWSDGDARIYASLTPVKERETWLLESDLDERCALRIHRILAAMIERLGVAAFNLAVFPRPLGNDAGWSRFPVVVRILDRGLPGTLTSDIGSMELFASSVVAADPFGVAAALR